MQNHKITFQREDGDMGFFYIMADNDFFAVTDFMLMTGNPRESVISVEVDFGHRWVRVQ